MGADPSRCLVIEDSEMGLRAARAAGMAVWHFVGGAHMKEGYNLPADITPDRTVPSMEEMGQAFAELGVCRADFFR